MTKRYWISPAPTECDLCQQTIRDTFYDARVRGYSSWANVCDSCFKHYGIGLGIGRGQRYEKQSDGKYVCTEGGSTQDAKGWSTKGADNTADG